MPPDYFANTVAQIGGIERMKVELKPYTRKYFFYFTFRSLNFRMMKRMGIFRPRFIFSLIKGIFVKVENYKFMIIFNGKIVGGVTITKTPKKYYEAGAFIFNKYQGRGIGVLALKELFKFAKKKKFNKLTAVCYIYNKEAIKLVRKVGFKEVKRDKINTYWEKKL
jgi:ribosomal protein S18 acetylase RimI-like enzyme